MPKDRIYLNLLHKDKLEAQKLGASWDEDFRGWWIPTTKDRKPFQKWLPRMFRENYNSPHIICEMVPKPNWFINLRSLLAKEDWNRIRKSAYIKAGYCCQVCGQKGDKWPVECNEQWQYLHNEENPKKGKQKLLRFTALCPKCHSIKHLGLAIVQCREEEVIAHLGYVNGWGEEQCDAHIEEAFEVWDKRSEMDWSFDLSILDTYGIKTVYIDFQHLEKIDIKGVVIKGKNLSGYFGFLAENEENKAL